MTDRDKFRCDYVLYFHRNAGDGEIFYVGVGQERRAYELNPKARNFLWRKYVSKYGKPKVEIYKSCLNAIEANYLEKYFINKFGRLVSKTGRLTNLSIGGEGSIIFKRDESIINKTNEGSKWYKPPKGKDHWSYGTKLSDEMKKKLRESLIGKKQTAEHIEKRVAPRRGKRMNEESIKKMAANLRGKKLPEDVKLKIGQASKRLWETNEFRTKIISVMKGRAQNKRRVINIDTGVIYNSAKEAAEKEGYKQTYFTGMVGGVWNNKTRCKYLEER